MASPTYPKGFRIELNPRASKPYRAVMTVDGKRERPSFSTEKEAHKALDAAVKAFQRHGAPAVEWDAAAHREWSEARRLLAGHKVTLPEVAAFWLRHGKRDCPAMPVPKAVAAFLEDKGKQGRSDRHMRDLDGRLGRFAMEHAKRTVEQINAEDVLAWIHKEGGAARSKKNNLVAVQNFMNYARRRGWTDAVPDIHKSDMPAIKPTSKGILTVEQTHAMFAWLETTRPRWVAWFALQAFAGLRNAESRRFRWEWFNFDRRRITIPAHICKTGDDWVLVGLPDNVWAWLEKYHIKDGPMARPSEESLDKLRDRLVSDGIIPSWPKNALRHSFATYHISLLESADKTALLTRHQSATMLWKSYLRHLVGKEVAEAYFAITPGK